MSDNSESKLVCPNCAGKLQALKISHGVMWSCFGCKGRAVGVSLLQKISDPTLISQIWMKAQKENRPAGKPCPSCRRAMLVVTTGPEVGSVELDVCTSCFFIWFDRDELEKVPRTSNTEVEKRKAESRPNASAISFRPSGLSSRFASDYEYDGDDGAREVLYLLLHLLGIR